MGKGILKRKECRDRKDQPSGSLDLWNRAAGCRRQIQGCAIPARQGGTNGDKISA